MSEHDTLTPQQIIRKKAQGQPIGPGEQAHRHRHIIAVLLENSIGALNRVINLFSARGFNLESVTVGETDEFEVSRMTIVTTGEDRTISQVNRQLNRLIDVLEVEDLTSEEYVERELCLLKIGYTSDNRVELLDTLKIFHGKVVDITTDTMTFEIAGPTRKINAFVGMMHRYGIEEVARSGRVAMKRALFFGD